MIGDATDSRSKGWRWRVVVEMVVGGWMDGCDSDTLTFRCLCAGWMFCSD